MVVLNLLFATPVFRIFATSAINILLSIGRESFGTYHAKRIECQSECSFDVEDLFTKVSF